MRPSTIKEGQKWQSKTTQKIATVVAVSKNELTYNLEGSVRQHVVSKYDFMALYAPTFYA